MGDKSADPHNYITWFTLGWYAYQVSSTMSEQPKIVWVSMLSPASADSLQSNLDEDQRKLIEIVIA